MIVIPNISCIMCHLNRLSIKRWHYSFLAMKTEKRLPCLIYTFIVVFCRYKPNNVVIIHHSETQMNYGFYVATTKQKCLFNQLMKLNTDGFKIVPGPAHNPMYIVIVVSVGVVAIAAAVFATVAVVRKRRYIHWVQ